MRSLECKSNFELLRIAAMIMIIICHVFLHAINRQDLLCI